MNSEQYNNIDSSNYGAIYECFFSGGRDSALACYMVYEKSIKEGSKFRLVFIDTGTGLKTTKEYIGEYARWLNAELTIIKTPYSYWELAEKYGYPLLFKNRWCIEYLKKIPLGILAWNEAREFSRPPVWVMGVRKDESLFRLNNYNAEKYILTFHISKGNIQNCVSKCSRMYWCPILNMSEKERNKLIDKYGIPINPVWTTGISGECLCLAGTTKKTLDKIIMFAKDYEPETLEAMITGDELVQKARRRKDPSFTAPLLNAGKKLSDYIKWKLQQKHLII